MLEEYRDEFKNLYEALPNGKVFRLTFDPIVQLLKLICKRKDLFEEIQDAFAVENPGAFFSKQYGYNAAKKLYQINKFGYFSPGIVFEVLQWIKTHYGSLDFIAISGNCAKYINDVITPLKDFVKANGHFEISNISEDLGRNDELRRSGKKAYEWRDYLKSSVEALIFKAFGRGIIQVPTAGGKSFIIANFIWNCLKHIDRKWKFLILVPNTLLVEQFYSDLIDYGYSKFELAKFKGGMSKSEKALNDVENAKIVIANRQYIFKNSDKLPKFDALFCDEVHTTNAESTREFICKLDCKVKVGCSGTLPLQKYDLWNLVGTFGRVVFKEEITNLLAKGYISKLKITLLDVFHRAVESNRKLLFNLRPLAKYCPDEFGNSDVLFNDAYNAELDFCNTYYEELYKPVLEYLNTLDENILVLFDRLEVGNSIYELAKTVMPSRKVHYVDGSTDIKVREDMRTLLEATGDNILFALSTIFATGINIKRLNHVVFCFNTKAFSKIIQAIGRTLRLHSSKTEAHLVDVAFNFKYSLKHYAERLKYYKQEYKKNNPDETIRIEI